MIDTTLAQEIFQATISMASISLVLASVLQILSGSIGSSRQMKEIDRKKWTLDLKSNFKYVKIAALIFSVCTFTSLFAMIFNIEELSILSIVLFVVAFVFLLWPLKNLEIAPENVPEKAMATL